MEKVDINSIKGNPDNPRAISKQKFELLKKSIQEFPEMLTLRPLVIDKKGFVLGGNMRLRALKALGYTDVPVIRAESLTEAQKREFVIKDNASFGEWDMDILANEWSDLPLQDWGLDIPVTEPEVSEDDFEIPETIKTDIKLGDMFQIGNHRLLCGDSTKKEDVERLMNGEKADMLTDPPYGININMNMGRRKGKPKKFDEKDWDKGIPDFYYLLDMFTNCIIWGGNYFDLPKTKNWLCWYKKTSGLDFGEFELAYTTANVNTRLIEHHWGKENKEHPTMKPITVISWALKFLNAPIIFDPFLGSGTTMVASEQLNRKCYGIEISPEYCQVIIDRMKKAFPKIEIKKL